MYDLSGLRLPRAALIGAGAVLAMAALSACTPVGVVVGGAASVAVAAAQERSVGDAVDDTTITVTINHLLFQKSEKLFLAVSTEVVEGRVLLIGVVERPEDRIEVTRLAWRAKGVREVINELEVDGQTGVGAYVKDAWISTQLSARLLTDLKVSDINYNIETVNGVVYLIGIARDRNELARVTGYARAISGVRKVISHVRLKDDPRRRNG